MLSRAQADARVFISVRQAMDCIDEDDLINQESTWPHDAGHAAFESTDFLDTIPIPQHEIGPPTEPDRSVLREPIERAIARHESASVALAAAMFANQEATAQRPQGPQSASPVQVQVQTGLNARNKAEDKPGSTLEASPSQARTARVAPRATAISATGADARPHPECWAFNGRKTYVATFSSSRGEIAEPCQSPGRSDRRQGMHRGHGFASLIRAALLTICVATLAAGTYGALRFAARPGAGSPGTGESAAASQPTPIAVDPAPQAHAAAAQLDSGAASARPSTMTPDVNRLTVSRSSAVATRMQEARAWTGAPHLETDPAAGSRSPVSGRGAQASNTVASAVEAAQAKADAFLRGNAQVPSAREAAESSPGNSLRGADRH